MSSFSCLRFSLNLSREPKVSQNTEIERGASPHIDDHVALNRVTSHGLRTQSFHLSSHDTAPHLLSSLTSFPYWVPKYSSPAQYSAHICQSKPSKQLAEQAIGGWDISASVALSHKLIKSRVFLEVFLCGVATLQILSDSTAVRHGAVVGRQLQQSCL